jgi:hypothetical protein
MDSVHGHLGPGCRTPSGGRRQRRVGDCDGRPERESGQTGPTVTFGWTTETETCWSVRKLRGNPWPTSGAARRSGSQDVFGRPVDNGAVVEEPKELGPPQLDSARSVPIGARTDGTGNRVSVKRCQTGSGPGNWCRVRNAASPATPKGETGDVNRSSRRLTPDVRPVVDLSTSSPEGCAGESRSPDGALSFFQPAPTLPNPEILLVVRA